jgi:hypothetical protein
VGYGLNPSYDGATPTKPSDSNYRYVFNGWTPSTSPVEDDVVYTATYKSYDLYGSLTVTFDTDG